LKERRIEKTTSKEEGILPVAEQWRNQCPCKDWQLQHSATHFPDIANYVTLKVPLHCKNLP